MEDAINIYKRFRTYQYDIAGRDSNTLTKRFDEPTYFSFRLLFGQGDNQYNSANYGTSYDTMPHPLFSTRNEATLNHPSRWSNSKYRASFLYETDYIDYSALNYLENANEPTRVKMLEEFITKFQKLQGLFPYYFQSIEGVRDLLKIDTTKGQRISNDTRLKITCLEGLDLRMSYLLNLYRKIVWDDVYQRWVLPDMMRYFTLKIYLSEFRNFHLPEVNDNTFPMGIPKGTNTGNVPLVLKVLDDILPTWEITCEMCEFDINDIEYTHLDDLRVDREPDQGAVKFGIKVGNIKETQIYPMFKHMFLADRKLNAINRTMEDEISTEKSSENKYTYPVTLQIAQAREFNTVDGDVVEHRSGMPYNEYPNQNDTLNNPLKQYQESFNPAQPDTWIGNAIDFGKAYAQNFAEQLINKAKVTSIPGMGVSYNEIQTALQSKNIVAALGTIRKGITTVVNEFGDAPSSRLEQPIQTDNIMKELLAVLAKSEATDDDSKFLNNAANKVLTEKGLWKQIVDYSMATNLVGPGEHNESTNIENKDDYSKMVKKQSLHTSSIIGDELPSASPNAATGKINEDSINVGKASEKLSSTASVDSIIPTVSPNAATGEINEDSINTGKASEELSSVIDGNNVVSKSSSNATSGKISEDSINTGRASSELGEEISASSTVNVIPSERLSSATVGSELPTVKPSTQLSDQITEKTVNNIKPSSNLSKRVTYENLQKPTDVKTKIIDTGKIIEATPSSELGSKIQGEKLTESDEISRATSRKIEGKLEG